MSQKIALQAPKIHVSLPTKQMKELKEPKFVTHKNLDKSGEIAIYYGFTPKQNPEIKKADLDHAKNLLEGDFVEDESEDGESRLPLHVEEKVALLRTYQDENLQDQPQPIMLYFKGTFKGSIVKKSSANYPRYCDLEIIGSNKSVAEAILIKTAMTILNEEGYKNICVDINSIGDRDSIAKFGRELTNYYRKHINDLHPECRQILKRDPFDLLSCKNEKCQPINDSAPKSINFLSESSRQHFQEILEYLEKLDIPYRINNNLIGNRKYCTETVFELVNLDYDKKDKTISPTLAIGTRYDGLAKRIGAKKEIPGTGISLLIKGSPKSELKKEVKKTKKPSVYFIQLGFEAKLQSLKIIETLRQAKIPVYQSLSKDKLLAQITTAEKLQIPYTILMGKKEAMEGSVIVRDMTTRSQETVAIDDLVNYMKKCKGNCF